MYHIFICLLFVLVFAPAFLRKAADLKGKKRYGITRNFGINDNIYNMSKYIKDDGVINFNGNKFISLSNGNSIKINNALPFNTYERTIVKGNGYFYIDGKRFLLREGDKYFVRSDVNNKIVAGKEGLILHEN